MQLTLKTLLIHFGISACLAQGVSFPRAGTGMISCINPISSMVCIVDNRSRFVAGMQQSYGGTTGFQNTCSNGFFGSQPNPYQTTWNMANTNSTDFPKLPDGQYDPLYYYPPGGLITQVIVLQANNPWGNKFGVIPAIIFTYLTPGASGFQLNVAVCGNGDYARFYLNPAAFPPPPTQTVLQAQYVSPLTPYDTPAFLGKFGAKCSQNGGGFLQSSYLGGDPHTSSKNFIIHLQKVCFARLNFTAKFSPARATPFVPNATDYSWWNNIDYQPCFYNKMAAKSSPSASCASTGQVIATGKYAAIMVGQDDQPWEMTPDVRTGKLVKVASKGISFDGVQPASQAN